MSLKKREDLSLPLGFTYPDEFGDLDEDEKELIIEHEALDLVLIENASELFRMAIQKETMFEKILKELVGGQKNKYIRYLDSETFPFYVSQEKKRKFYPSTKAASSSQNKKTRYTRLIEAYKKRINRDYEYVSIVAVDAEESGGHYAAFYYSNNKVTLFDSMQTMLSESEKDSFSEGVISASEYTQYFYQLAMDIFPGSVVEIPDCIKKEVSLQYTGGFTGYLPYFLEEANVDENTQRIIISQTTESQNHFCYLWSMWWIHLKLLGLKFENILNLFDNNDPLIVIKKYGWCLVKILNIPIEHEAFFNKHFLSIWSNGNDKLSIKFNRYDINIPQCNNDINNAFFQSIANLTPTIVKNTHVQNVLSTL